MDFFKKPIDIISEKGYSIDRNKKEPRRKAERERSDMKDYRTYGKEVTVEVEVYGICKYNATCAEDLDNSKKVQYRIIGWDIVNGEDARREIEAHTDGTCIDDYHEYLVLHLVDGDTATFRNSYVDMFRVAW